MAKWLEILRPNIRWVSFENIKSGEVAGKVSLVWRHLSWYVVVESSAVICPMNIRCNSIQIFLTPICHIWRFGDVKFTFTLWILSSCFHFESLVTGIHRETWWPGEGAGHDPDWEVEHGQHLEHHRRRRWQVASGAEGNDQLLLWTKLVYLKVTLDTAFSPSTGSKSGKLKTEYKHEVDNV